MSTENPRISNFKGVEKLAQILTDASLVLSDGGEPQTLTTEFNEWRCNPDSIPVLSITLHPALSPPILENAVAEADLKIEDLDLVVISEDPFLKERHIIFAEPLANAPQEVALATRAGRRHRSLSNSTEGLRIEALVVLRETIEIKPGRPHRAGTKLAQAYFRVKGYPESSGISPIELTTEIRQKHGLSRKTQMFVETTDELLEASSLSEAVWVYVDEDLLKALRTRRSGREYDFVSAGLAINALQHLTFALSAELIEKPDFHWGDTQYPVLEFVHQKLNEVARMGEPRPSRDKMLEMLRNEPGTVSALLTGLLDFTKDARKLVSVSDEEV